MDQTTQVPSSTDINFMVELAQGNPGAMNVLGACAQYFNDPRNKRTAQQFTNLLIDIKRLGLRGPSLWVAMKDNCDFDVPKFLERVKAQDETLKKERY